MEPRKKVRKVSRLARGLLSSCLGGGGRGGAQRVRMTRVIRASGLRILADVWNGKEREEKAFRVRKGSHTLEC